MPVALLTLPAVSPTGFSVGFLLPLADFSYCSSRFTVRVSSRLVSLSSRKVTYTQVQRWRHSRTGVFFRITNEDLCATEFFTIFIKTLSSSSLPGCGFKCPWERFVEITTPIISPDVRAECRMDNGENNAASNTQGKRHLGESQLFAVDVEVICSISSWSSEISALIIRWPTVEQNYFLSYIWLFYGTPFNKF